jgi:DNA-binding transcriptional regulator YiaG
MSNKQPRISGKFAKKDELTTVEALEARLKEVESQGEKLREEIAQMRRRKKFEQIEFGTRLITPKGTAIAWYKDHLHVMVILANGDGLKYAYEKLEVL